MSITSHSLVRQLLAKSVDTTEEVEQELISLKTEAESELWDKVVSNYGTIVKSARALTEFPFEERRELCKEIGLLERR